MHSTAVFASTDFDIVDRGQAMSHARYFSGFARTERLGLFAPDGCEGAGATLLVMACVTAFYDRYREEGGDFFAYPDFFSFQRRQPPASYTMFDIWPGHKDVPVPEGANETAAAVTDRGVGILLLPDRPPRNNEFHRVQMASLERNVKRCLLYSEEGQVGSPPSRSPPRRRNRSAIGRKGCSTRWRGTATGSGGASASSTPCRWTEHARASGRSRSNRLFRCCSRGSGPGWAGSQEPAPIPGEGSQVCPSRAGFLEGQEGKAGTPAATSPGRP